MVGLWPAHAIGDDVELFSDLSKKRVLGNSVCTPPTGHPNQAQFCLSDYIAPKGSGRMDYLGAFAVNAGKEVDELAEKYKADNDDFTSILVKSLGDRLPKPMQNMPTKNSRPLGFGESEGLTMRTTLQKNTRNPPALVIPANLIIRRRI